jgi:hypothetical protein
MDQAAPQGWVETGVYQIKSQGLGAQIPGSEMLIDETHTIVLDRDSQAIKLSDQEEGCDGCSRPHSAECLHAPIYECR